MSEVERRQSIRQMLTVISRIAPPERAIGDNWQLEVVLEKIIPVSDAVKKTPISLGGERRCPPEDVGGAYSYEEFLEAVCDPGLYSG
jgi:hypothetical protein